MKINISDIIVNSFLIITSYAFVFFVSRYMVIEYNLYLGSDYSIIFKVIIFVLSVIATFFMLALPMFGYFRKGDSITFFKKGDVKYSWGIGSTFVWILLVVNMFLLPMIAYLTFNLPTISFVVLYIISALFGFSLGIETKIENTMIRLSADLEKELRSYFDDSISGYLPYILLTCCILFPVEYLLEYYEQEIYIRLSVMVPLLILVYYASRFISNKLFSLIDLKKGMPNYTRYGITIIPIVGICLFQSWELFVSTNRALGISDRSTLFIFLLFTGILPIRLLYVYEPDVHILNRIITIACLVIYTYTKFISY